MNRTFFFACVVVAFTLLGLAAPALAGGWATITVDEWPVQIGANEPVVIGFTVRQHGRDDRRLSDLDPTLSAKNTATGRTIVVHAKTDGAAGHYVAVMTFPEAGSWSWSIQAFGMDQPMPDLLVSGPAVKPASAPVSALTPTILAGVLGLACVCLAAGLAWRKRKGWALALAVVGLLMGAVGLASAAGKPANPAPPANQPAASQLLTQAEHGKTLFIAKGCATCHVKPQIEAAFSPIQTGVGKDLTNYVAAAEFLRLWLKDPKSVKPNTEMPNLELSQVEIEALIAFINNPAE